MPKLPEKNSTIDRIDAIQYGGEPRPYLGMSGIGRECMRQIWYGFHWTTASKHSARTQRIFDFGHLFEELAIKALKEAGCFVFRVKGGKTFGLTGKVGEEQEEFIGFSGHEKGHCDGRIKGLSETSRVAGLEIKSMKNDKFLNFKKNGVAKSHPVYYGQIHRYGPEQGLTLYYVFAINKDTQELWGELVELDPQYSKDLKRKAQIIIMSDEPPDRAYSSDNYNCGWCAHYGHCHVGLMPEKNCRTCEYSDLEDGGKWSCSHHEKELSVEEQRKGCDVWTKGWGL